MSSSGLIRLADDIYVKPQSVVLVTFKGFSPGNIPEGRIPKTTKLTVTLSSGSEMDFVGDTAISVYLTLVDWVGFRAG